MTADVDASLLHAWQTLPDSCRSAPATHEELAAFEREYGPIPPTYRRFLETFGGGVVGHQWLDSIAELPASHRKFEAERKAEGGWTMEAVFIIGWDGSGNPLGLHLHTGELLVEDHDFGGIHRVADSFEAFLAAGLLGDNRDA